MTRHQQLVLDIIREAPCHRTAEEIYLSARERVPSIAVATVYNALTALCRDGLIARLHTGGQKDAYDRTTAPHAHCVCQHCGRLTDLFFPSLAEQLAPLVGREAPFYELYVHGVCEECQQKIIMHKGEEPWN